MASKTLSIKTDARAEPHVLYVGIASDALGPLGHLSEGASVSR